MPGRFSTAPWRPTTCSTTSCGPFQPHVGIAVGVEIAFEPLVEANRVVVEDVRRGRRTGLRPSGRPDDSSTSTRRPSSRFPRCENSGLPPGARIRRRSRWPRCRCRKSDRRRRWRRQGACGRPWRRKARETRAPSSSRNADAPWPARRGIIQATPPVPRLISAILPGQLRGPWDLWFSRHRPPALDRAEAAVAAPGDRR